ncbi:GNAT family N-acetyltransferase [Sunxiuqinia sp. A32]|uniref:GNAT family N-acetyltransferase n=1 Tax=Sunxiuqinia sp. A32 TaxID=3461496 RepID=UPI0040466A60
MNKKVQIRVATLSDALAILKIYEPFILNSAVTFEEDVPTITEFEQRLSSIMNDCPCLVCELEGKILGYAYASAHRIRSAYRRNKEVSVYIDSQYQRNNIAKALYTSLFAILKEQGFVNLLAGITIPNPASIGFHESMGFEKCAEYHYIGYKLGKWHSVGWWELCLLENDSEAPIEPIPFYQFQKQVKLESFFEMGVALVKI